MNRFDCVCHKFKLFAAIATFLSIGIATVEKRWKDELNIHRMCSNVIEFQCIAMHCFELNAAFLQFIAVCYIFFFFIVMAIGEWEKDSISIDHLTCIEKKIFSFWKYTHSQDVDTVEVTQNINVKNWIK